MTKFYPILAYVMVLFLPIIQSFTTHNYGSQTGLWNTPVSLRLGVGNFVWKGWVAFQKFLYYLRSHHVKQYIVALLVDEFCVNRITAWALLNVQMVSFAFWKKGGSFPQMALKSIPSIWTQFLAFVGWSFSFAFIGYTV